MTEIREKSPRKTPKRPKKIDHKFDISEIEEDEEDSPLKKFQFIDVIGEGAFGKVYQAKNKSTKEDYAIKAIKSYLEFNLSFL